MRALRMAEVSEDPAAGGLAEKGGGDVTVPPRGILERTKGPLLYAVSLAALGFLVWKVEPARLLEALSALTLRSVLALAALSAALLMVSVIKWKTFLRALGSDAPLWRLSELYLIAYFVNALLPSRVGGDAVRSWSLGRQVGQERAFTATILERYTGLVAMLTLACLFAWGGTLAPVETKIAVAVVAAGAAGATAVALSGWAYSLISSVPPLRRLLPALTKVRLGLLEASKNPKLLLKTLGLSLVFHTLTVVNTAAAAAAVGWSDPSFADLFVVVPLILLVASIPITPSGLGIQEGAFYYFLHKVGATPEQALGVAVVLRVKTYALALVGGVFWLKSGGTGLVRGKGAGARDSRGDGPRFL